MGGTQSFGVVLTHELDLLVIPKKGRRKGFHPLKGVAENVLPFLEGGRNRVQTQGIPIL